MAAEVGPIAEEVLRRRGAGALKSRLGQAETSFPRRPNGAALLLKEGIFERLISQKTPLSSFPASDISAAQGDLRHLSLEQLLAVQAMQGDAPTAAGGSASSSFWNAMEQAILERLASRLQRTSEVARLVLQIYGAQECLGEALPAADHWLLEKDQLLYLPECVLQPLEEEVPVYAHSDLLKGGMRRKVHWEVQHCKTPAEFKAAARPRGSLRTRPRAKGYPVPVAEAKAPESGSEETASEEEPAPGSRPRIVTAGLCSQEQAAQAAQRGPGPLAELAEELKLSRASEALANEDLEAARREMAELREIQAKTQEELATAKEELSSARDAEASAREELSKLKEEQSSAQAAAEEEISHLQDELAQAKDAEASAKEGMSKMQEELDTAKAAEASAEEGMSKLQGELTAARDAEASAKEGMSKMQEELDTAKAAEASAKEGMPKLQEELEAAKAAEADLTAAKDAEAASKEALSKLQEELTAAKDAEAASKEALSKFQEELTAAKDAEAASKEALSKLQEELTAAKDAEAASKEALSKLQEELTAAKDAEAASKETLSKLQEELTAAKDAEAASKEALSKLQEELIAAKDAEAASKEALSKLQEELTAAKDAEASRDELSKHGDLKAGEAEVAATEGMAKSQEELTTARDAEASAQVKTSKLQEELEAAHDAKEVLSTPEAAEEVQKKEELEADDGQEPPTSPAQDASPWRGALKASVDAAVARDEDQDSFASFESCEGGLVWRSPQKEI